MTIKVNFRNNIVENKIINYVLFSDENFKILGLSKTSLSKDASVINKTVENYKIKDNNFLSFNIVPNKKIVIVKLKNTSSSTENEKTGAQFYNFIKENQLFKSSLLENNFKEFSKKNKYFIDQFIHGTKLKSYYFGKYKSKNTKKLYEIEIISKNKSLDTNKNKRFDSLIEGINFTKDLVSEPGNILHPDEYAKRLILLKKIGLKVTVFDKKKLKQLGMNALLGVGQGSIRGSYLVTLEWNGANSKKKPLAFVGKGVCFDTGGISLKPAKFMEDMTYDMAGSAVVVGLMKNFALRKAKINAVGVV